MDTIIEIVSVLFSTDGDGNFAMFLKMCHFILVHVATVLKKIELVDCTENETLYKENMRRSSFISNLSEIQL